jgi:hypothetical protein
MLFQYTRPVCWDDRGNEPSDGTIYRSFALSGEVGASSAYHRNKSSAKQTTVANIERTPIMVIA